MFRGILIAVLVGGGLVALRLALGLRRRQRRPKSTVVLGEEIEQGMTAAELANAADVAARSGDYRSAIRKLYVSLLFDLSEKGLIELDAAATNREYLKRIAGSAGLWRPMARMTDLFDYFWYGTYGAGVDDYGEFRRQYNEGLIAAGDLAARAAAEAA